VSLSETFEEGDQLTMSR